MARGMRFAVLMFLSLFAFQSCTCNQDVPEPTNRVEQRGGFNAALPTRRRESRQENDVLARTRLTPEAAPPLPTAADAPTRGTVALPDNFPADVPVFENAEAVAVQNVAHDGHTVLFHVDAEPKAVFGFYKDKMDKNGWNMSQEYQTKGQSFLSFKKGSTVTNVTIAKDPKTGKQVIALMYYDEPELPFPEF